MTILVKGNFEEKGTLKLLVRDLGHFTILLSKKSVVLSTVSGTKCWVMSYALCQILLSTSSQNPRRKK